MQGSLFLKNVGDNEPDSSIQEFCHHLTKFRGFKFSDALLICIGWSFLIDWLPIKLLKPHFTKDIVIFCFMKT